jgi:hypothetical protein
MSLNIRELSPALKKYAEENLNEDSKQTPEMINQIRDWIKKSPHLKIKDDPQSFLTFLRGKKFSLEKTKQLIDNFYSMFELMPEVLRNRDPFNPNLKRLIEKG